MKEKRGELKNTLLNIKKLGLAEFENETISYSQSLQIANESHIKQRPVAECRGCLKRLVGSASGGWGGSEAHTQRPSKVKSRHGCRGDNFGSSAMTASGSGRAQESWELANDTHEAPDSDKVYKYNNHNCSGEALG